MAPRKMRGSTPIGVPSDKGILSTTIICTKNDQLGFYKTKFTHYSQLSFSLKGKNRFGAMICSVLERDEHILICVHFFQFRKAQWESTQILQGAVSLFFVRLKNNSPNTKSVRTLTAAPIFILLSSSKHQPFSSAGKEKIISQN